MIRADAHACETTAPAGGRAGEDGSSDVTATSMLAALGEAAPDLLFAKDRQSRMLYANPATLAVIGRTSDEVLGRTDREWHADRAEADATMAADRRVMHLGRTETVEEVFSDARLGGPRLFQTIKTPLRDLATGNVSGIVAISRDITEMRRGEAALAESEARFRLATQAGRVGVFDWNLRSGALRWDDRLREIWGVAADEEISIDTFRAGLHPDDVAPTEAAIARSFDPAGGGAYEAEYRVICRTDGRVRHIVAHGRAFFEDGAAVQMIGSVVEITALREAEQVLARDKAALERLVEARTQDLRETQQRLAQAEKLSALGQLAGGIAHDFNNVLQGIASAAELLRRRAGHPLAVERVAGQISQAALRGASITQRLLTFARRGSLRAEPIDAARLLDEFSDLLEHTLGRTVAVAVESEPELPPLLADRGQFEAALINLATNARDAMPAGGTVRMRASRESIGSSGRPSHAGRLLGPDLSAGLYVRVSVTDTGTGIPPDLLNRVGEPFFTTKPLGTGTGLGLSIASSFAEQSGGTLAIDSEPGRGTTVTLWFPAAADGSAALAEPPKQQAATGHRVRVLLVEDDLPVRELIAAELEAAGYAVLQADGAETALALLNAGETADVLLTDLRMRGLTGMDLIARTRDRFPRLPAVLLTGFSGEVDAAPEGGEATPIPVLRKPVSVDELSAAICAAIAARA